MKSLLGLTILTLSLSSIAAKNADPLQFVPGGQVVQVKLGEYLVKTPNGTNVELEFTSIGNLDEAEGDFIEKDVFIPGPGLKTLKEIETLVKGLGYTPTGDWSFDTQILGRKIYEVDAMKDNLKWELTIDATDGSIIKEERD